MITHFLLQQMQAESALLLIWAVALEVKMLMTFLCSPLSKIHFDSFFVGFYKFEKDWSLYSSAKNNNRTTYYYSNQQMNPILYVWLFLLFNRQQSTIEGDKAMNETWSSIYNRLIMKIWCWCSQCNYFFLKRKNQINIHYPLHLKLNFGLSYFI